MRIVALVAMLAAIITVLGAIWPHWPLGRAFPDLVALVAVYLGITARARLAPAILGAISVGYVADVLMGSPPGAQALVAALACLGAHLVHRRLLVRGYLVATLLSLFAGLGAGLATLAVRGYFDAVPAGAGSEMGLVFGSALLTGAFGPLVFWLCRAVDARFARTERERDLALEGVVSR
jgi:rod shape-determining protein MreD